jgi:hypothetical protein
MVMATKKSEVQPLYLEKGPAIANYYPKWIDNLAADATVEGSMLDGAVQGDAVRQVVIAIRDFYTWQEHRFAGPISENRFLEDYVAEVRGKRLGCVVLVKFNDAGQTQRVVATYRPRSTIVFFARLLAEKFAGTDIGKHFTDGG